MNSDIKNKVYELNYVKHDLALCIAPGLFRSLAPGERKNGKLDITYERGDERVNFKGPEPLGVIDLRILQAMIALGGIHGKTIGPIPKSEIGRILRDGMGLEGDAKNDQILGVVNRGYGHLATEVGYVSVRSGKVYELVKEAIKRLMTITIFVKKGKRESGFHLISYYQSDDGNNNLNFALNPRLTEGIVGERQFAFLCMNEVRKLKSDNARMLHQKLAWINYGAKGKASIVSLRGYIYFNDVKDDELGLSLTDQVKNDLRSKAKLRKQNERTRQAIKELEAIGWKFDEYSKGKFSITKPSKREMLK